MVNCIVPITDDGTLLDALASALADYPTFHVVREVRHGASVPAVPRRVDALAAYAERGVRFEQPLEPVRIAGVETSSPVLRLAAAGGDSAAAGELYWRLYERILMLLHAEARLSRAEEDGLARQVFGLLLDATPVHSEDDTEGAVADAVAAALAIRAAANAAAVGGLSPMLLAPPVMA